MQSQNLHAAVTHEVVSWCSILVRLATNSRYCMQVQAVDDAPAEVRMSLAVLLRTSLMPAKSSSMHVRKTQVFEH